MLYAEYDPKGKFVRERHFAQPLPVIPRWIDGNQIAVAPLPDADEETRKKWDKSQPVYRPLVIVETPLDPSNYRPAGFQFRVEPDGTVSKISLVEPLTADEKKEHEFREAKETRKASIPDPDDAIELILGILKVVVDRQLMTEVAGDPRTRISISKPAYTKMLEILKRLEATPVPNRIKIEDRGNRAEADVTAQSQRDIELNIFNNRVEQLQDTPGVPGAVKDAFNQLRKLLV